MYDDEYQAKKTFNRNPVVSESPFQFLKTLISIDYRSLALFRICLGFTVAYDVWDRTSDLTMYYTDAGILDRSRVLEIAWNPYWNSIYMMTGTWFGEAILCFINFIAGISLMIGYHTKMSSVLCWAFFLSFIGRNNYVGHSGDVFMRIILLFSCFLPLGEYYSVDDFLESRKNPNKPVSTKMILSAASLAVILQPQWMYIFSTYYKTGAPWTTDFTAAWMAIQLDWFRTPIGDLFFDWHWFLRFLTWATFYWERFGPLFLISPFYYGPLRTFGAFGFIFMHVGFFACLRLDSFFYITAGTLTTLLPSWFWEQLFVIIKSFMKHHQISIHIHSNIPRLVTFIQGFAYFFLFPESEVTSRSTASPLSVKSSSEDVRKIFQENQSAEQPLTKPTFNLMVLEKTGASHFDLDALILVFRASPIFWPLALFGSSGFGRTLFEKLYFFLISGDKEADDEEEEDEFPGQDATKKKPVRRHLSYRKKKEGVVTLSIRYAWWILWNLFILYLLLLIFQWNMTDAGFKGWRVSADQRPIVWTFGLDQSWRMFAPQPPNTVFYHVIEGELKNGEKVELFKNGALYTWEPNRSPDGVVSFDKPDPLLPCYKNHRGFKYWENGFNTYPQNDKVRLDMGRYICREYNARHQGDQRLVGHKIWIVWERVKIESRDRTRMKPELLWNHVC